MIPSFVARVERPDRGGEWVAYLRERREAGRAAVARLGLDRGDGRRCAIGRADRSRRDRGGPAGGVAVRVGGGRRGRDPAAHRRPGPDRASRADRRAGRRTAQPPPPPGPRLGGGPLPLRDRLRLRRVPRPPAPPAADLPVAAPGPDLGAGVPEEVREAGAGRITSAPSRSPGGIRAAGGEGLPEAAPYALCLGYRIRYVLDLNAREAMHLIELRSGREGHPTYRAVAQAMHERIADVHPSVAAAMTHVDSSTEPRLERILSEIRTHRKVAAPRWRSIALLLRRGRRPPGRIRTGRAGWGRLCTIRVCSSSGSARARGRAPRAVERGRSGDLLRGSRGLSRRPGARAAPPRPLRPRRRPSPSEPAPDFPATPPGGGGFAIRSGNPEALR